MTTCKDFARYAESLCGSKGTKYQAKFQLPKNSPWSAAFVSACLSSFESTSGLISSSKCSDFESLAESDEVRWIARSECDRRTTPKEGDVVLINWKSNNSSPVNKVGIVRRYSSSENTVDVVIGDCGADSITSTVSMRTYSADLTCIKGYVRIKAFS